MANKFRFSIDRGGTFTDVYAECPGGKVRVMKLLSEDPTSYADAPREAIRRIIEQVYICMYGSGLAPNSVTQCHLWLGAGLLFASRRTDGLLPH